MVVEHQYTAKPQHDDDHHSAQKLAHGVCQLLSNVHVHDIIAVARIDAVKLLSHLFLGTECFDDAQTAEGFLYHAHRVAP